MIINACGTSPAGIAKVGTDLIQQCAKKFVGTAFLSALKLAMMDPMIFLGVKTHVLEHVKAGDALVDPTQQNKHSVFPSAVTVLPFWTQSVMTETLMTMLAALVIALE